MQVESLFSHVTTSENKLNYFSMGSSVAVASYLGENNVLPFNGMTGMKIKYYIMFSLQQYERLTLFNYDFFFFLIHL